MTLYSTPLSSFWPRSIRWMPLQCSGLALGPQSLATSATMRCSSLAMKAGWTVAFDGILSTSGPFVNSTLRRAALRFCQSEKAMTFSTTAGIASR